MIIKIPFGKVGKALIYSSWGAGIQKGYRLIHWVKGPSPWGDTEYMLRLCGIDFVLIFYRARA